MQMDWKTLENFTKIRHRAIKLWQRKWGGKFSKDGGREDARRS